MKTITEFTNDRLKERRKHWLSVLKSLQKEKEAILFCSHCGETESFKEEWDITYVDGCDKYGNGNGSPQDTGSGGDTIRFCYNCDSQINFVTPSSIIDDMITCIDKDWGWNGKGLNDDERNAEIIKRVTVMRL